jgi:acyl-CoA reductase-like NAD-dependent aldehyde dehydrogenase
MADIDLAVRKLLEQTTRRRPIGNPDPAALASAIASDLRVKRDNILAEAAKVLPFSHEDVVALFDDTLLYLDGFAGLVEAADAELAGRSAKLAEIDASARMVARPHGRVLVIIPANATLPLAVVLPVSFACAGNHVIVAASSGSRELSLNLAGLVARHLPDRITLWRHGVQTAVDALLGREAIDALYFMGSSSLRASISGRAAEAGVTVIYEGQGMGAALVDSKLSDERLDTVADQIVQSKTRWGGQMCSSPNVLLVANEGLERVRAALERAADGSPLPRPLDEMLGDSAWRRVSAQMAAKDDPYGGATAAFIGAEDLGAAVEEELFGPAAYLVGYDDLEASLAEIDALRYRLQLSVFSDDPSYIDNAIARTRLARYCINRMPSLQNPLLPWGNFGKSGTSYVQNFFEKARVHSIVEEDRTCVARPAMRHPAQFSHRLEARCIVWAHPRSRSTAFERAFIERDDCAVLHEPLSKFLYFGADIHALLAALQSEHGFVADPLLDDVRHLPPMARYGIVKDFAYHALPYLSDGFLKAFQHIFLVRRPEPTIRSFHAAHPDFREDEVGYLDILALAERIRTKIGQEVLVVESDNFARDPEAVLRQSCAFIGMDYDPRMLRWQSRTEITAWGLWSKFHETALKSTTVSEVTDSTACKLPAHREELARSLEPVYREILSASRNARVPAPADHGRS